MPFDGSAPRPLPLRAAPPPRRVLGLEAPEWGSFLVSLGTVLCLAGALSLVALQLMEG